MDADRFVPWTGAASELVTPFDESGEVLLDLVADEVTFMQSRGVVGVMLNGFASETLAMNDQERVAIAKVAREAAPRYPLMGTVIASSTREGQRWVSTYEELGMDAVSISTPPLHPLGVDSIVDYYVSVARSASVPVYLYNSTEYGNKIPPEAIARIVEQCPNVVGYKDATQSLIELQVLFQIIGVDRMSVLSGSDALTVPIMQVGGRGVISLITTVFPDLIVEMCAAATAKEWEKAAHLQGEAIRVRNALKTGPFMAAYKHVSGLLGRPLGSTRHPIQGLSPDHAKAIESQLRAEGHL